MGQFSAFCAKEFGFQLKVGSAGKLSPIIRRVSAYGAKSKQLASALLKAQTPNLLRKTVKLRKISHWRQHLVKLSPSDIQYIKSQRLKGPTQLAKEMKIHTASIYRIRKYGSNING
jgi:hypothetical protein